MCDVCCARHAIVETKADRIAVFRWSTQESPGDDVLWTAT